MCGSTHYNGMAQCAELDDNEVEPPRESHDHPECSILHKLRASTKSDLACKRKIEKPLTTGADKKRRAGAPSHTNPKTVSPATRVKVFPGECLKVWHGKLFCVACSEELHRKEPYLFW